MHVTEIMIKNSITSVLETPVIELAKIMKDKSISSIILIDKDKPVGIITERDLVHRVLTSSRNPNEMKVADIASKPIIAISHHMDVEAAVAVMNDYNI